MRCSAPCIGIRISIGASVRSRLAGLGRQLVGVVVSAPDATPDRRRADAEQIGTFVDTIFRYCSGGWFSFRAFYETSVARHLCSSGLRSSMQWPGRRSEDGDSPRDPRR